jgi:MtN3 and saliva related transmembrane protein
MNDDLWLQIIVIIANVIGFAYNIPQMILTIRTKRADDISGIFLLLRIVAALLWTIYTIYKNDIDVLISWIITGTTSLILLYYKYFYSKQILCNNKIIPNTISCSIVNTKVSNIAKSQTDLPHTILAIDTDKSNIKTQLEVVKE